MNAAHRYSCNVTWTPHFGVTRNRSSRVNHCSVKQVSSLLMTLPWHLTHNKVFHPDLLRKWFAGGTNLKTFYSYNMMKAKTVWISCSCCSFSSSLIFSVALPHHPPAASLSSQPVCSLISPCPERIDEALVSPRMFIGECLQGEKKRVDGTNTASLCTQKNI